MVSTKYGGKHILTHTLSLCLHCSMLPMRDNRRSLHVGAPLSSDLILATAGRDGWLSADGLIVLAILNGRARALSNSVRFGAPLSCIFMVAVRYYF